MVGVACRRAAWHGFSGRPSILPSSDVNVMPAAEPHCTPICHAQGCIATRVPEAKENANARPAQSRAHDNAPIHHHHHMLLSSQPGLARGGWAFRMLALALGTDTVVIVVVLAEEGECGRGSIVCQVYGSRCAATCVVACYSSTTARRVHSARLTASVSVHQAGNVIQLKRPADTLVPASQSPRTHEYIAVTAAAKLEGLQRQQTVVCPVPT